MVSIVVNDIEKVGKCHQDDCQHQHEGTSIVNCLGYQRYEMSCFFEDPHPVEHLYP
jgi:hypothetical protein